MPKNGTTATKFTNDLLNDVVQESASWSHRQLATFYVDVATGLTMCARVETSPSNVKAIMAISHDLLNRAQDILHGYPPLANLVSRASPVERLWLEAAVSSTKSTRDASRTWHEQTEKIARS